MRKKILFCSFFTVCLIFFGFSFLIHGEKKCSQTLSPYFFVENGDPSVDRFPLKETDVTVNISGVIADVMVTQTYQNNGARPINARYVFPASTRAAVHDMTMTVGKYVIRAKIKERKQAQREFNRAKKEGKSASLLKQQRPNVFSMNVANIMPGEKIKVKLCYTELLIPTEGTYEFIYPTVVGPRYSDQTEAESPPADLWIKNPYLKEGKLLESGFNLTTNISTGIPLQEVVCTSHQTVTVWENKSVAKVKLDRSEKYGGNRDYSLRYRLCGKKIQTGLMLFEGEKENYFLLMSQPPERVTVDDIPSREYIFVVDVSGSMHGFPLDISKKLLRDLIGNLRSSDRFNVVLFASASRVMAPSSVPATKENIQKAIALINHQRGGGGTRLLSAMKRAVNLPENEDCSRSIIIATDGYIAAEKTVFDLIRKNIGQTNVFSFGIGSSVNRFLIEGMARAGAGEPFVITKKSEASGAAKKFREYIQSPVLTDISVKYDGFKTHDIEPSGIPDLFAKRPILVFGKWKGRPRGTIIINGTAGYGKYSKIINVSETKPTQTNRALRFLWARTKIANLSDYFDISNDKKLVDEIISLGLSYNLLTRHTSFIAVCDVIRNPEGQSEDVVQPLPLPKGVSNLAVGGGVSSTPEPGMALMLFIGLVMFASIIYFRNKLSEKTKTKDDDG